MSEPSTTPATTDHATDRLISRLRAAAARVDPPPAAYVEFAKQALSLTRLDVELGTVLFDSYTMDEAGARSATSLAYSATIEFSSVTLDIDADGDRLSGRVTPPQPLGVCLQSNQGDASTETDAAGWFTFDVTGDGPFRVLLTMPDGSSAKPARRMATDWFLT